MKFLISIFTEYGIKWFFYRGIYFIKLKIMRLLPFIEFFFEKEINILRIDIFLINTINIENFILNLSLDKRNEVISIADKAIKGKIIGFSSIEMDYGFPINWHLNPLTNKTIDKNLKWFNIPDFDTKYGDIKGVWEISRFTHFYYFLRSYMITKDIKYYYAFSNQLSDWIKNNHYSYGPNFKCGQEATLRMINSLIAYEVFKSYNLTSKKDEENVKKIVETSYRKVQSNFFYAHKCIKNNHTLTEITGLIIGAWCSNDDKSLKNAYVLLNDEIDSQFFEDGGYIQYSFNYQRFALQLMEFILKISTRFKYNITMKNREKLKKSVLQLFQLQDESGLLPNYGSNDGSLIFPLHVLDYLNYKPIINSLYALLTNSRLYEHGDHDEELLWFLDNKIHKLDKDLIRKVSSSFTSSGLYSLRDNSNHMMIVSKLFKSRPAQMDQLHIDLWYRGINVLCDSGTYSYASKFGENLSLTSAHNTLKVQGVEQMNKLGKFMIYNWANIKTTKFSDNYFQATMDSKNKYSHTRTIIYNNFTYKILDSINVKKEYEINFHTSCEILHQNNSLDLIYRGKKVAEIITNGQFEILRSKTSSYYLRSENINLIKIKNSSNKISEVQILLEKTN